MSVSLWGQNTAILALASKKILNCDIALKGSHNFKLLRLKKSKYAYITELCFSVRLAG